MSHKVVAINTAIDHKASPDNGAIAATLGEYFCLQGNFVSTGNGEGVYLFGVKTTAFYFSNKGFIGLLDDILMPVALNKRDALRRGVGRKCQRKCLIHGHSLG